VEKFESYPEVRVNECEHFDPYNHPVGIRYCEDCNSLILFCPFMDYHEEVKEDIIEIICHETMHWVLRKEVGAKACSDLDILTEEKNLFYSAKKK